MIKSCRGPEVGVSPGVYRQERRGRQEETSGAIDAVLTFEELRDMFEQAGIDPADDRTVRQPPAAQASMPAAAPGVRGSFR